MMQDKLTHGFLPMGVYYEKKMDLLSDRACNDGIINGLCAYRPLRNPELPYPLLRMHLQVRRRLLQLITQQLLRQVHRKPQTASAVTSVFPATDTRPLRPRRFLQKISGFFIFRRISVSDRKGRRKLCIQEGILLFSFRMKMHQSTHFCGTSRKTEQAL